MFCLVINFNPIISTFHIIQDVKIKEGNLDSLSLINRSKIPDLKISVLILSNSIGVPSIISDLTINIGCGSEYAVASTKTFTSTTISLYILSKYIYSKKQNINLKIVNIDMLLRFIIIGTFISLIILMM